MNLFDRNLYIDRLFELKDNNKIKFLTGVRGSGKSSIFTLFTQKLIDSGVDEFNIIRLDLESSEHCIMDSHLTLYEYISISMKHIEKAFILIDEIQRIKGWQMAIHAIKKKFNADIYLSSSGTNIINDDLFRQLEDEPIEVKVLPLSFKEFKQSIDFFIEDINELFYTYLYVGGMPELIHKKRDCNLRNIFYSNLAQDVFAVNRIADNSVIIELAAILCKEIGNIHSFNSISKLLAESTGKASSVKTIENYIKMLTDAKLFYSVPVFDTKSNNSLTRYAKYYPVDIGFYRLLTGEYNLQMNITSQILECVVYFELLRLNVKVSTCKVGNKKVAFIAENEDNKIYIHVTNSLKNVDDKELLNPLRSINDHYSKWIITLDNIYSHSNDGIRIINIIDFLTDN